VTPLLLSFCTNVTKVHFIDTYCASVDSALQMNCWVIQARERYQASASFKTFLFHIARNRLVDHYRRQGTGRDFDVPDGIAEESIPARVSDQPERQVHAGQQIEQLLMLVRDLPAEQREAFLLHEEAGLAVAGIAEVTGVGHETAKSRLRYALQRLREGLREWV